MLGRQNNTNRNAGTEIESYLLTATEKDVAKMEKPMKRTALNYFWFGCFLVFLILAGRIIYLNIFKGDYYHNVSQGNRIRSVVIQAPRGKIMDRQGTVLVNNIPAMDAVIFPVDLPRNVREREEIIFLLSQIFQIEEEEIRTKINNIDQSSNKIFLFKENISREESLSLVEKSRHLPGLAVAKSAIRDYSDGLIFSHIIGYEGKISRKELDEFPQYSMTDYIGKEGIEKSYESVLKGKNGAVRVEIDSKGRIKRELGIINPEPGNDIILTVDGKLQKKIYDELVLILEKTATKTAAAVAINPKNGEVLALISLPGFDNNLFSRGLSREDYQRLINNPDKPLFNRAIAGEYPPGSTIKPIIAVAALAEGVIDESSTINCAGAINIGNHRFGDWKTHGVTDLRKAIAESCDVYFYSVGGGYANIAGLGISRMKKYGEIFGLGKKTGIDLPGESSGLVPDEQWKMDKFQERWYTGDSYNASIGQGYVVSTPLQLANYVAAIANNGILYKPRLVSQIRKKDGESVDIKPEILQNNADLQGIIKIVQEGMRQTVISGTARSLRELSVEVAGKTGTAQFGSEKKTHAWFVSYAPYQDPEIALVVLVEGGGEGSSSAVPMTKEVYRWYFKDRD